MLVPFVQDVILTHIFMRVLVPIKIQLFLISAVIYQLDK